MIKFVNNSEPDITDENLNKMQQDIGTVVSATEPQGDERLKVWIKKGKNFISINELSNNAINESTGVLEYNKTRICSNFIYLFKGTYSISCNLSRFAYAIYDEEKQFNKFVSWNSFPAQITIEKNCFIRVEFVKNADGSVEISKNDISILQLEQNSIATSYEAYIEPEIYVLNNNGVYELFSKNKEAIQYDYTFTCGLILHFFKCGRVICCVAEGEIKTLSADQDQSITISEDLQPIFVIRNAFVLEEYGTIGYINMQTNGNLAFRVKTSISSSKFPRFTFTYISAK